MKFTREKEKKYHFQILQISLKQVFYQKYSQINFIRIFLLFLLLLVFFDISCFPFELFLVPDYLWVKYGDLNSVEVSTKDCKNIGRFIKAIKKEFSQDLDQYSVARIDLFYKNSVSGKFVKLRPGLHLSMLENLPDFEDNSDLNPLIIQVSNGILTDYLISSFSSSNPCTF